MTRFLVATSSVHVTAAAADYLQGRIETGDDVVVVAVRDADAPDRDAGDAANVARSRLAEAMPTTEIVEGDPVEAILSAVSEHDPDELVVGPHRGVAGAGPGPGSTARALIERVDRPVVVVPVSGLD